MIPTLPLTFEELTRANVARCNRWHPGGITDWSPERWYTAAAGECGEIGNALKKLFRVEDGIANINEPGRHLASREEAVAKIGEEIADTVIYLNLLAVRLGIVLAHEVALKFNATSEKYDFPERLPLQLWCVHISGPDDVIACVSLSEAQRVAIRINQQWQARHDPSPNDPMLVAEVARWPYSSAAHGAAIDGRKATAA